MKIAIIGSGAMGLAALHYLLENIYINQIILIDNNSEQLSFASKHINIDAYKKKLLLVKSDADDISNLSRIFKQVDIIIGAIPWKPTLAIIKASLISHKPFISVTRPDYADLEALQFEIEKSKGTVILGCGLEPGLTEIFARYLSEQFTQLDTLHIRCGGIPLNPKPPLYYKSVFTQNSLPITPRSAYYIQDGILKKAPRFSAIESINIKKIGLLEAWHDGMLPWLVELLRLKQVKTCTQKTIRWPGFAETVSTLASLGLLSTNPITIDGTQIIPKLFVDAVLNPITKFQKEDRDVVILKLFATGKQRKIAKNISMELLDNFDEQSGYSAMARVTGYTLAICACLLAGEINLPIGLIRPELFVFAERFVFMQNHLAKQNIHIQISEDTVKNVPLT